PSPAGWARTRGARQLRGLSCESPRRPDETSATCHGRRWPPRRRPAQPLRAAKPSPEPTVCDGWTWVGVTVVAPIVEIVYRARTVEDGEAANRRRIEERPDLRQPVSMLRPEIAADRHNRLR